MLLDKGSVALKRESCASQLTYLVVRLAPCPCRAIQHSIVSKRIPSKQQRDAKHKCGSGSSDALCAPLALCKLRFGPHDYFWNIE